MKLIVAGSRSINNYNLINNHLSKIQDQISEIVSGGASGVDRLGEVWAKNNNKECVIFPADWTKYGKAAGPIRNEEMAKYADSAVIFWDGQSSGSKNMYETMKKYNKPVTLINQEQQYKQFDCGCKFPINENGGLNIVFKAANINLECPKTWKLLCNGDTLGVFQLETQLGQSLSKKLEPQHLEHLSALAAIIRPGSMESIQDGKSITQHYIDRRHGREEIIAQHPALAPILKTTMQEMIYQEDALNIAKEIAGFSLVEANSLRKAIGKKLADKMKELEETFLQGCRRIGKVNEDEAKEIFESIRKSQRYSFNKCLHPKTTVETYGGCLKSLDTLKIGDHIKCPSKNWDDDKSVIYKRVVNVYHSDNIELYDVILENNTHIKCSSYHKFIDICGKRRSLWSLLKHQQELITELGPSYIRQANKLARQSCIDIEIEAENGPYSHMFFANHIITSNSHSVSYAYNSYMTAYAKAHFPLVFFKNYLKHAISKPKPFEEIKKLVLDAKKYNIEVQAPQLNLKNQNFKIINNKIYFGLTNIRGIGDNIFDGLINLYNKYDNLLWSEFLFRIALSINKKCIKNLIAAGALSDMNMSRHKMLFEHDTATKLTVRERQWIIDNINLQNMTLQQIFESILSYDTGKNSPIANKNRYSILQSLLKTLIEPTYSLRDTPQWISAQEESLLGIGITCCKLDGCNIDRADTTCNQFYQGKSGYMTIAGEIDQIREYTTKNHELMGFLNIHDNTGSLNSVVIFPQTWSKYKHVCEVNYPVLFYGKRDKSDSFIVERCFNLK